MGLSQKTLGRIEALAAVEKLSPSAHKMLVRIVEDAVAESQPATTQGQLLIVAGDWPENYQDLFWTKYPKKVDKKEAMKLLDRVARAGKTRWADLESGLDRYILSDDVKRGYAMSPARWVRNERWNDQEHAGPQRVETRSSFDVAKDLLSGIYGTGTHQG